jgi:hypothetical protein
MALLSRVREANRKLNDRIFPRSKPRYVDRFRELVVELSEDAQLVLHLGSGSKDLGTCLGMRSGRLRVLNLDIGLQDLERNPGQLRVCADGEHASPPYAFITWCVRSGVIRMATKRMDSPPSIALALHSPCADSHER